MPRSWARIVLAFATTLAAWLVVMPARAAAPLCDDRGATGFAPAPQLQSPEVSIDLGGPEENCLDGLRSLQALDDGRAPQRVPAPQMLDAMLPEIVAIAEASAQRLRPVTSVIEIVRPGIRDRVDRPPR
jgi:hypothetical protein